MKKLTVCLLVLVLALSMTFAQASSETKKITVWSGYPEMEALYKQAAKTFETKHPGVEVEVVTYSLREFEQKLNASIPAHACADVFDMSPSIMRTFIEAGLVPAAPKNVVDFMNADGRYAEDILNTLKVNGKSYGVPFFAGKKALYYNTQYFAEAGLTEPPKTFDELYEYAKKLTKYDEKGNITRAGFSLRLSGQGSGTAEKFWFFLYPMGASIIEEGKTPGTYHAGYNNEGGLKALKFYIDGVYKDHFCDHQIQGDTSGFELGYAAMYFRESDVVADIAKKVPDLPYATAPMPADVKWGTMYLPEYLFVSDDCKDKDLAWEYVLECVSAENQPWLLKEVGWIPLRQDVDYTAVTSAEPGFAGFTFSDPDYLAYMSPDIACFDEIETKLAERIIAAFLDGSLVNNEAGMKKVLADAAAETDAILKRNNAYGL